MLRSKTNVALLLVFAFLATSCATLQTKAKGFTDMTPKEKSTFFMGIYNRNFDETMALAIKPVLTENEKNTVRVKKAVLVKMKPIVSAYDAIAVSGGTPSAESEAALLVMVDQLVAATTPTAGVK